MISKRRLLRETYLAVAEKTVPPDAVALNITRADGSPLGPSWDLLNSWRAGLIKWADFESLYLLEIEANPSALRAVEDIIELLKSGTAVYLICYERRPPCHRFVLKRYIEHKLNIERQSILDDFLR